MRRVGGRSHTKSFVNSLKTFSKKHPWAKKNLEKGAESVKNRLLRITAKLNDQRLRKKIEVDEKSQNCILRVS